MLVQAIYLPLSTIFLFFIKSPMVVRPYSVHITMAKFSPIFQHKLIAEVLKWLILC